jgi:methylmalonyl-CoA/ethylmalonyl-CoA epimerase
LGRMVDVVGGSTFSYLVHTVTLYILRSQMQFDHLGIIVYDLAEGRKVLTDVLGVREWTSEFSDSVNRVCVQFGRGRCGPCYELIAPLSADSPISNALASAHRVINHVAYVVADLEVAGEMFRERGCMPIGQPKPAVAYGGRRIQFFVTSLRFITELIEAPEHTHRFDWGKPGSAYARD